MPAQRGLFAALVSLLVSVAALAATVSAGYAVTPVAWPISTGLVLAEVVTGGASASDEYVEIANAAPAPLDLNGLEVVYVTASGSTVTRKTSFTSPLPLAPGQHFLLANGAGIYGPLADATYSGGLAADGGSLALRSTGGSIVDAVGWGSAANSFVEGSTASAPPARSSIERRPGGADGNRVDTNDNLADWLTQPNPAPQSLTSTPTPGTSDAPPTASGSDSPAPTPPATESPSMAEETGTPEPTATPAPTSTPTSAPTAPPAGPTATGLPTEEPPPSASASAPLSASPTSTPGLTLRPIADARAAGDGAVVTVEGVLTTRLAVLEGGRGGFLQDSTAGIGIYLSQVPVVALSAGTQVRVSGTLDDRYGQRVIRVSDGGLDSLGEAPPPEPLQLTTGGVGEVDEGLLVAVSGIVLDAPDALADGLGISIDDGSGPLRVVATPTAVGEMAIVRGTRLMVVGPLGQRVSGSSPGYRVQVTEPGSIVVVAGPSPSAPATALPSGPSDGSPGPTAAPSPSPTEPETALESIAAARAQPAGMAAHVAGVVTVAAGVTGTPELFAVEDSSGGIFVRVTAPIDGLVPGRSIELAGVLAAPYGQLEIRGVEWLSLGSQDAAPAPRQVRLSEIGEPMEGSLVMVRGSVDSVRVDSGRLTLSVGDGSVAVRVLADPPTGLSRADVARGDVVALTGIVGQRASATGRADGYRLWLRSRSDLVVLPADQPPSVEASAGPSASAVHHDLASAIGVRGSLVDVDATVTAQAGLFDLGGPTVVVEDGTAAVAVILPSGTDEPRVGSRLQVIGRIGRWEGGPTVVASQIVLQGDLQATRPLQVSGSLGPDLEWRLVRVCGRIDRLTRAGSRWRAELLVDGHRLIVLGEPGAGISAASMTAGRLAVVTGVVRRSTSDSSVFQLLPRSPLDVRVGPAPAALSSPGAAALGSSAGGSGATSHVSAALRVDISTLPAHLGERVTVSGLVVDSDGEEAIVDDGTGEVRIGGPLATAEIDLLEPGDAIEVTGIVAQDEAGLVIEVDPISMVSVPGDGSSETPATEPAVGLRLGGSPSPRGLGAASIQGDAGAGAVAPGIVGAIIVALLAALASTIAVARMTGHRAESLVQRPLAVLRQAGRLPRPAWHLPFSTRWRQLPLAGMLLPRLARPARLVGLPALLRRPQNRLGMLLRAPWKARLSRGRRVAATPEEGLQEVRQRR
jgi:uncharacterized protein YdeI (BOF family)